MKQTMTRDGFIHNLKSKDRSDNTHHNIMILGHVVFDLHDAVDELHNKFDELLKRTNWLGNVGPTTEGPEIKMATEENNATTLEINPPVKPLKMTLTDTEDEGVESF